MLESTIESYLVREVRRRGGLIVKLNAQFNKGIPDRLAIMPGGVCIFIELKQSKGRAQPAQIWWQNALRGLNQHAFILRSKDDIDELLRPLAPIH